MNPLVSIVIPTYNRAYLIGETIQSVIDQTFRDWEIIVVDDGSEDHTEDVIRSFNDIRIRYLRIAHNGIFGFVRNQGIKIAKAGIIAFLDSDDLWRSDKLEIQLSLLQNHPDCKFVFSNIDIIGDSHVRTPDYEELFAGNVLQSVLYENRFVFYPSCLLFSKEVLERTGLVNEDLPSGSDMNFFFALSARFPGVFTNQRLTKIRKHEGSTSDAHGIQPFLDGIFNVNSLFEQGFLSKNEKAFFISTYYYRMGLAHLARKQFSKARNSFANSVKHQPINWKGWIRFLQSGFKIRS